MSELTTGAQPEQCRILERCRCSECGGSGIVNWRGITTETQICDDCFGRGYEDRNVPPDHRIIGPDDLTAIRHIYQSYRAALGFGPAPARNDRTNYADLDRLAALAALARLVNEGDTTK